MRCNLKVSSQQEGISLPSDWLGLARLTIVIILRRGKPTDVKKGVLNVISLPFFLSLLVIVKVSSHIVLTCDAGVISISFILY